MEDEFKFPQKHYGPFFMKILNDFIEHHHLPKNLPMPDSTTPAHVSLARITNVMLHSMGEEKRNAILQEMKEYMMSIPACFR